MASARDTATFFSHGTSLQFEHVLELYPQALRLKAERKAKKAEELIKLDNWFQNELPKKIKSRGRDAHLVHDELVQCMKWKQSRGKFYPQLSYLVKVNTPRMVVQETKKAFRKLPNLEQAITALSNLKGVGTTMASAVLAAASPELAPFMADECLMAIPEIEGIDYTIKEYLKFANHITNAVERLNQGKREDAVTWSPHKVELAIWTHFIVTEMKPELLSNLPTANGKPLSTPVTHQNGDSLDATSTTSDESNSGANGTDSSRTPLTANGDGGSVGVVDDDTTNTTNSYTEDSLDKLPGTPSGGGGVAAVVVAGILNECDDVARDAVVVVAVNEETSDSVLSDSASNTNDSVGGGKVGESVNKRPLSGDDEEAANDADDAAISCKRSRLDDTDSKEVVAAEDK